MFDRHKLRLLAHLPGALWRWLTPEQQRSAKSFSWAFSTHFLLLIILGIIIFPSEQAPQISIMVSLRNEDISYAEFTVAEDLEVIDMESIEALEESVTIPEPEPVISEVNEAIQPPELGLGELVQDPLVSDQAESPSLSMADSELNAEALALATETQRRVRAAGGSVEGKILVSLMYDGYDDLDLAVSYKIDERRRRLPVQRNDQRLSDAMLLMPRIPTIWYGCPFTQHGRLDVDANAVGISPEPCENIVFTDPPERAQYKVFINHFRSRQRGPTPYVVIVTIDGKTRVYEGSIRHGGGLREICSFRYP